MPELPEVETIRRDLIRVLLGKKIKEIVISKAKIVKSPLATFRRRLTGQKIKDISRRGKLLIFSFQDDSLYLLVHLKMTGQLIYQDNKKTIGGGHGWPRITELPNKYSHAIFTFSDKSKLFFNDMRQFGYLKLVDPDQLKEILSVYGYEPLSADFSAQKLHDILRGRKTTLKNVLLNQQLLAGLGNIYVDESCFLAKIKPTRISHRVTKNQAADLYSAIKQVLKQSLKDRGTTFGSYRDGLGGKGKFVKRLRVYGRSGLPCKTCRTTIKRIKIGGRGTAYCPQCQK